MYYYVIAMQVINVKLLSYVLNEYKTNLCENLDMPVHMESTCMFISISKRHVAHTSMKLYWECTYSLVDSIART